MFAILGPQKPSSLTLSLSHPSYSSTTDPGVTFTIANETYTRDKLVAEKRKRDSDIGSVVWQHGEKLIRASDDRAVFYCYQCERQNKKQLWLSLYGTSTASDHLKRTHGLGQDSAQDKPNPSKIRSVVSTTDFDSFKSLLIKWVVYCHIAFAMLENQYFRDLIKCLNAGIIKVLPAARSTLRNWVKKEYEIRKDYLIEELETALSSIHLSFDIWTSPNRYSIISVFGNFVNHQGQRRRLLLAFRRIYGSHSGENISTALLEVISEYKIEEKVGYFVSDNAKNNDVAIDHLLQRLYPALSLQQRQARRLRCFGHITNLCARALLLGKGAGKALTDLERKESKGDFEAADSFWKGKGALGQLHNIVVYIRTTPQRLEEFAKVVKGGRLAQFDKLKVSVDFLNLQ